MIDLTTLFNALIALMAAVITAFVIPWIKATTTVQQRKLLESIVQTLVFAAEQLYGAGKGEEKLQYVVQWLTEHGYTVDTDMIEATVKAHFGHWHVEDEDTPESADQ